MINVSNGKIDLQIKENPNLTHLNQNSSHFLPVLERHEKLKLRMGGSSLNY